MENYIILTDSSCDMPEELVKECEIDVCQLDVTLDGEDSCPNNKLDIPFFYAALRAKRGAKTNAVPIGEFIDIIEKYAKNGTDVLYIGFSSGLSATFNNGRAACAELSEKYPERKLIAVDSLCASLGQGLLVYYAAKMKKDGATIEETADFVTNERLHLCHQFTVDDLFFLHRGGRVSAATAVVGSALGIKPVLHVDNEGHLINIGKARGRKASIVALFDAMKRTAITDKYKTVFISHGDCEEEAKLLADMVENEFHPDRIVINYVGPVIGAHSGPGTIALFYYGSER